MALTTQRDSLALLIALLIALGTLGACEPAPAVARVPAPHAAESPLVRADTATIDVPRAYAGQVYVERDVAVAAQAAGVLDSLTVDLGATVHAGQALAVVDRRAQEIAAASARERLTRARSADARARQLAAQGGVTGAESEQIAGELRQAELVAAAAEQALSLTRVTAPFDGVITARYARPRQLVTAGDTLFRVAERSPQLVRVRVAEPAAHTVRRGDVATVRSTGARLTARATIALVAPAMDAASGTREVVLRVDGAPFLAGEGVVVQLGSERRVAIVVPRASVSPDGYVLVADGGRTTLRPIALGADVSGGRVEVVSGLAVGERLAPPRR